MDGRRRRRRGPWPWILLFLVAMSLYDQLRRPAGDRDWHGRVLGFVPYDFRLPTLARLRERWWNPDDGRIVTPRAFGIGWAINLYQVRRQVLLAIGGGSR